LIVGILIFCLLFFGGLFLVKRRADWEQRIRKGAIALLLVLSLGISTTASIVLGRVFGDVLTKPWFSARNVDVTAPAWLRGGLELGNFQLPYSRVFIIILTAVCLAGIYWFLNRSTWGLRIRSVTQNRSMSACLGIPTDRVDALTFALGSGLAGIAGCAITLLGSVGPNTGQNYIVDTFMVVVVGGVGNLLGAVIAALAIGTVSYLIGSGTLALLISPVEFLQPLTDLFNFFATTSMAKVLVFVLIIAFLQVKPAGIFPQKGRTAEL
jgi:urea transport system permease protein